jgi:hypothetical protein
MAITVRNDTISLNSLVSLEMATVAIEISGYLHHRRGKAVPHCSISYLVSGQVLFHLDHSIPLVEGCPHVEDNSSGLKPGGGLIVRHVNPVYTTVKGQLLENCCHHFHRIRMRGQAKMGSQLVDSTQEEGG